MSNDALSEELRDLRWFAEQINQFVMPGAVDTSDAARIAFKKQYDRASEYEDLYNRKSKQVIRFAQENSRLSERVAALEVAVEEVLASWDVQEPGVRASLRFHYSLKDLRDTFLGNKTQTVDEQLEIECSKDVEDFCLSCGNLGWGDHPCGTCGAVTKRSEEALTPNIMRAEDLEPLKQTANIKNLYIDLPEDEE